MTGEKNIMRYTDRIAVLNKIAKSLKRDDLLDSHKTLRKFSDTAELIGHPRNPSKAYGVFEVETKPFQQFKEKLDEVERSIFDMFEVSGNASFHKEYIRPFFKSEKIDQTGLAKLMEDIAELDIAAHRASPSK